MPSEGPFCTVAPLWFASAGGLANPIPLSALVVTQDSHMNTNVFYSKTNSCSGTHQVPGIVVNSQRRCYDRPKNVILGTINEPPPGQLKC
ncbi:hypothetical protein BV22DRAFT_907250 [Leucogyrophana mollusca]|uniref:Uncharacterized protein n=1 Tax=Leucogyrophana mollusca TaxID=85980 RepID=A0ACB8AYK4_9AGAM|nr:hypothetical protein BV22DRAFT_907250 [Leucogyrophana mollusca]